jgi:antibiotic biosynthesis monooxygenase (ABM) superfamily enzyme
MEKSLTDYEIFININMEEKGASVVITHHIVESNQMQYEQWLEEIGPVCRNFKGNVDWQIIRPIPDLTYNYTVIIRFDTVNNLKNWMESKERKSFIEKAKPLFARGDSYYIKSGLDFLFPESKKPPLRWKQYLVTWSAIYPLSVLVPLVILPLLQFLHLPESRFINAFFISGCVVFIMIFILMPSYTKLIRTWLYR